MWVPFVNLQTRSQAVHMAYIKARLQPKPITAPCPYVCGVLQSILECPEWRQETAQEILGSTMQETHSNTREREAEVGPRSSFQLGNIGTQSVLNLSPGLGTQGCCSRFHWTGKGRSWDEYSRNQKDWCDALANWTSLPPWLSEVKAMNSKTTLRDSGARARDLNQAGSRLLFLPQ